MTLVVLIGGARSGKSRLAVERAQAEGKPVTFIATGEALDDEMTERIEAHKRERPAGWTTIEEPIDVARALAAVPPGETAIVDCLSLWVANGGDGAVPDPRDGLTVAVTNEVGLGIVPDNALARAYRDDLGRVNAAWVDAADEVYLVVAGKRMLLG
ncbi:MAG TPA: bifunctional adenosylcobinamide kinase/adenosylcobinamide-phosphate guanylyltransferase [Gaiellaceae bacterium]|nr:bifunctional adenosylcobinamide kinase/adenosylcobinamide-phosphate guanylyltransferase [Gaiellaceae bacterium]